MKARGVSSSALALPLPLLAFGFRRSFVIRDEDGLVGLLVEVEDTLLRSGVGFEVGALDVEGVVVLGLRTERGLAMVVGGRS